MSSVYVMDPVIVDRIASLKSFRTYFVTLDTLDRSRIPRYISFLIFSQIQQIDRFIEDKEDTVLKSDRLLILDDKYRNGYHEAYDKLSYFLLFDRKRKILTNDLSYDKKFFKPFKGDMSKMLPQLKRLDDEGRLYVNYKRSKHVYRFSTLKAVDVQSNCEKVLFDIFSQNYVMKSLVNEGHGLVAMLFCNKSCHKRPFSELKVIEDEDIPRDLEFEVYMQMYADCDDLENLFSCCLYLEKLCTKKDASEKVIDKLKDCCERAHEAIKDIKDENKSIKDYELYRGILKRLAKSEKLNPDEYYYEPRSTTHPLSVVNGILIDLLSQENNVKYREEKEYHKLRLHMVNYSINDKGLICLCNGLNSPQDIICRDREGVVKVVRDLWSWSWV